MCRVLVVDDSTDITAGLCDLLRLWGHEPRAAGDGLSALSVAADFLPEVVLLDIAMPGMDGHEVAARLRALPGLRDAFIIALSGCNCRGGRVAPDGAFDVRLLKPADPAELERLLSCLAEPAPVSAVVPPPHAYVYHRGQDAVTAGA